MEIVAQSDYNWSLLANADQNYFSVLCGGVAMYAVEFQLTAEESSALRLHMPRAADDLANKVRQSEPAYRARQIAGFSEREDVRLAGLRWRKAHRSGA
jgi:hypothetical protein